MSELARAKVNLSLHITGKRSDGYHLLDSIVVFPEVGDVLRRGSHGLSFSGPFAAGLPLHDNLVRDAAALLGVLPDIHLEKNLPIASGIGGGSADAAATLRLLAKGEVPDGLTLGADVPACVISKPLRMQGIGEQLTLLPKLPDFAIVLANSGEPVATAAVFAALEQVDNPASGTMPKGLNTAEFFAFITSQRNDMQQAAVQICPSISGVLSALQSHPSCALARMSGSGGTCFGLFESLGDAKRVATEIQRAQPSWWVVAAKS
ncbi:MAG: 4-(cytidine 5'-diphospho)-2-C-methyl-D-erythritol kinase [Rhodobacteraceae bacterium]|nr:4-(cytidine 5'-diphospho)-2-C-methyl-D-erythritol kinase [Paracoccaceae bacterium]